MNTRLFLNAIDTYVPMWIRRIQARAIVRRLGNSPVRPMILDALRQPARYDVHHAIAVLKCASSTSVLEVAVHISLDEHAEPTTRRSALWVIVAYLSWLIERVALGIATREERSDIPMCIVLTRVVLRNIA